MKYAAVLPTLPPRRIPTRVPCAAARLFALALLAAPAAAQMGRRSNGGDPRAGGQGDVDMAMAGWEQLSQNPDKMAEVMASLQDPEVAAKAQEMLKDPEYMRAAKAKLVELQAKAQQNGLLDANGQPVQNNMAKMMAQMGLGNGAGMPGGGGGGGGGGAGGAVPREWEADNIARHRTGELNDAELGMANLKQAMGDPALMGSIREMMKDPNTMREVRAAGSNSSPLRLLSAPDGSGGRLGTSRKRPGATRRPTTASGARANRLRSRRFHRLCAPPLTIQVQNMMADPAFKAQAEQAAQAMKGGGMDFSALAQQMGATMGGAGAGAGAGGAAGEMERLQRETLTLTLTLTLTQP